MGVVANATSSRSDRAVNILFTDVQVVAIQAKFLHRHDELSPPLYVTGIAKLRGVGTMAFVLG